MRHLFLPCFVILAAACGGSDHHEGVPSCEHISEACHPVDTGTGRISECHETAHDVGTAAACDPIEAECVALCEAAVAMDGGTHDEDGGEHDHDAGADDHDAAEHDH